MIKMSLKTRILNFIRLIFTLPVFENVLVFFYLRYPNYFLFKLIPSHYLYSSPTKRKVTRFGYIMDLDISHVVDHSIYFGIKDSNYVPILNDIRHSSVILDIGANIGSASLYFSSVNPAAKIFSFEPHPKTFKRALDNITFNNRASIHLQNYGLGASEGTFKMYELHANNPGMNRILPDEISLPFVTIQVHTLDHQIKMLTNENIGFIKIDVEGYEKEVLLGGQETLRKNHPTLFIELDDNNLRTNGSSAYDLIQFLIKLDYTEFINANTGAYLPIDGDFKNCHFDIIVR